MINGTIPPYRRLGGCLTNTLGFIILVSLLLLAACDPKTSSITCPSSHEHPPAFWAQVAVEAERIMDTAPAIMTLLDENRVNEEAIRICLRSLKGKKKK